MAVLHLGVIDVEYTNEPGKTTGDVAEILEAKYHVMEIFSREHGQEIADTVAAAMLGAVEAELMGAPNAGTSGEAQAATDIQNMFQDFLSHDEMAHMGYPGVPTAAALKGKSVRFKRKKGNPRPSFIDSGLYQASMRVWGDDLPGMTEYGWAFAGLENSIGA